MIIAGGQIFITTASRFVNVSKEEINLMKENAIPRKTKTEVDNSSHDEQEFRILPYTEQGRLLKILNLFNLIVTKFNIGTLKILPISQAISSWSASLLNRKTANIGLLMLLFGSWENKLQLCIMQIRLSPP